MPRLRPGSLARGALTLGTLSFVALPMLAAGCAENQATSSDPVSTNGSADSGNDDLGELGELGNLEELSDDFGAPMESGSGLGSLPESGSGLGEFPEAGSGLGESPESGSGLNSLPELPEAPADGSSDGPEL